MKKALIIIAAVLLLAGCNRYEQRVRLTHVEYQGHTYIIAEAYVGTYAYQMHIMHDPDCLCHHKVNE